MEDIVLFFHSLHFVDIRFRWLLSSYIYRTWNRRGQKGIHCLPSKKRFRGSSWPYNFLMSVLIFLNFILHDDFDAPPPQKKKEDFWMIPWKSLLTSHKIPVISCADLWAKRKQNLEIFETYYDTKKYTVVQNIFTTTKFLSEEKAPSRKSCIHKLLSEANPCNFCNILCSRQ